MSKFHNTSLNRVPNSGGANQVTIPVGTTIRGGTGTGGATSVPCKAAWLQLLSGTGVRVNIGAAASATAGITVPAVALGIPLFIPIDDLNKLYFIGTSGDKVDILYRE